MKFFRDLNQFMVAGSRAHARWELEMSNNILHSRTRLMILGLLLIPVFLGGVAFADAVSQALPSFIGSKQAYGPAHYTNLIFGASVLVLTTHILFAGYVIRFQREVFQEMGRYLLVLALSMLLLAFVRMTLVLEWWSPNFIPISFVAVILAVVVNQRFAVEMTVILLLQTALCLHGYDDLLKIILFLFAGSITGILLCGGIRKRSKLINVGLITNHTP